MMRFPLIGGVISLGWGLGLILGYCKGTSGLSAAYPFAGSMLHVDFTTTGPGVLGGLALVALGVILLLWAFIAAIASLFAGRSHRTVEHVVERYSVVPAGEVPEGTQGEDEPSDHIWQRPSRRRAS